MKIINTLLIFFAFLTALHFCIIDEEDNKYPAWMNEETKQYSILCKNGAIYDVALNSKNPDELIIVCQDSTKILYRIRN